MVKEIKTKTAKKTTAKVKTTKSNAGVKAEHARLKHRQTKNLKLKFNLKLNKPAKKVLTITLIFLFIASLVFKFKHLFVAAIVNNRIISRYSLNRELEKQAGSQVLETLITKTLILQEAKQQKVKIDKKEIEEKIKEIEKELALQGADLDTFLSSQDQTKESFQEQIEIQLLVDKILSKEISVTEEDVRDYFEENKDALGDNAVFEELKKDLEKNLKQEKIREKFRSWLSELQEKSKIYYFLKF